MQKILMLTVVMAAISCSKDKSTTTKQTGTLSATSQTVDESAGTASITVTIPKAQSTDVTVTYTLTGTAIENGDYMAEDTELTIAAGDTSATLTFQIFDDTVVEDDKTIKVAFSSTAVSLSDASSTITITDNDTDPSTDGLNTELTWDAGSLVDLNLYTAYNVTITDDGYIDDGFTLLGGSYNEYGFESLLLSNAETDQEYYLAIEYYDGARAVDYTLNVVTNGNTLLNATYNLTTADVGYAYFIGPFTKSGTSFSRSSVSWDASKATPHVYKVKLKQ